MSVPTIKAMRLQITDYLVNEIVESLRTKRYYNGQFSKEEKKFVDEIVQKFRENGYIISINFKCCHKCNEQCNRFPYIFASNGCKHEHIFPGCYFELNIKIEL